MRDRYHFFSIIIPTYARPEQLEKCLRALTRLKYPRDRFEVIIVDDGSEVPLDTITEKFHNVLNLKLIRQNNAGPGAARNTGASHARGDYLAFTDDDCLPASDWLNRLNEHFAKNPDCMIGGKTINMIAENPYSTTAQLIIDIIYNLCNQDLEHATFLASNNLALPVRGFRDVNGFDTAYRTAEDRNLCARWLNAGYHIVYAPEAVINHASVLSFSKFWKQYFNYGRGAQRFYREKAHNYLQTKWSGIKFHLKLSNWLFYPFAKMPFYKAIPIAALLIVWEIANSMGFFWESLIAKFTSRINRTDNLNIQHAERHVEIPSHSSRVHE